MEPPDALVDAAWLAAHLGDPDLRILDCTVELRPGGTTGYQAVSGRQRWEEECIPGSAFADLIDSLSEPDPSLRFTMPTAARFADAIGGLGVGEGTAVVLYDRRFNMWATRVWWMLRAFGFDRAAVLDGGWRAWLAGGHPVEAGRDQVLPERARFTPHPRPGLIASTEDVLAATRTPTCILNALSPEQHRGDDATYGRTGHIPGAKNVYAVDLVDPQTHVYLPLDELRARFDRAGIPADPHDPVITYCGGGIAATSDAFALHRLGHRNIAVYDGSLSEWATDPERPLVTGD
jgi:thiosulfate/3-mercaptopyruvate sulfurtransferase